MVYGFLVASALHSGITAYVNRNNITPGGLAFKTMAQYILWVSLGAIIGGFFA